jgi:hypothetical protein
VLAAVARPGRAQEPEDPEQKRLRTRIELWASFAQRTRNLGARYVSTRESSLLHEPLVRTGTLVFVGPALLVLRDDGSTGSTTTLRDGSVSIRPNLGSVPPGPTMDPAQLPALAWLRDRFLALFAAGDGTALVAQCRARAAKSRAPRLELLPLAGSDVRRLLRSVTVELDAVGGAVLSIDIAEAQGDRSILRLSDHRQNIEDAEIARALGDAGG